jgi:hypothetical protein
VSAGPENFSGVNGRSESLTPYRMRDGAIHGSMKLANTGNNSLLPAGLLKYCRKN